MSNAKLIRETLGKMGYTVYGGVNAPYIWLKTPEGVGSWEFFDKLLNKAHVVTTPGAGFGSAGETHRRCCLSQRKTEIGTGIELLKLK